MTPSELIPIANVCCYLAEDDAANQTILKGGFLRPQLLALIDMTTESVTWLNTVNPSDPTLQQKTNFLQWLCMPYIPMAQFIINSGGTGQIVNPATGVASNIQEVFYQITVGDGGSPSLDPGDISLVITDDFIMQNSLQVSIDGTILPYGVYTDRLSYTVSYTNNDATVSFYNGGEDPPDNIGVQDQMVVQIRGQKFVDI